MEERKQADLKGFSSTGKQWHYFYLGSTESSPVSLPELWQKMRQFLFLLGRYPTGISNPVNPDSTTPLFSIPADQRDVFSLWSGKWVQILGYGMAWQCQPTGEQRFNQTNQLWQEFCTYLGKGHFTPTPDHPNPPDLPADLSFPIALGSFGFRPQEHSQFFAPQISVIRHENHFWGLVLPTLPADTADPEITNNLVSTPNCPFTVDLEEASTPLTFSQWEKAVTAGTQALQNGEAEKIVLARDQLFQEEQLPQVDRVLEELAKRYPDCWTYQIGDLFGASPEMLAQVKEQKLLCRVLAGTCQPGAETQLWESPKEQREHRVAVASAKEALIDLLPQLHIPQQPYLLNLKNVTHLASDLHCSLDNIDAKTNATPEKTTLSSLAIAGRLHPTAAVCGRPRANADRLLADLEPRPRGHYAAPIGWMDAEGNGEWAIALRCAQVVKVPSDFEAKNTASTVTPIGNPITTPPKLAYRLWAGAGIMPQSIADSEWQETSAKMDSVRQVLEDLSQS